MQLHLEVSVLSLPYRHIYHSRKVHPAPNHSRRAVEFQVTQMKRRNPEFWVCYYGISLLGAGDSKSRSYLAKGKNWVVFKVEDYSQSEY